MELDNSTKEKLKKVSQKCPNCGSKKLFIVPDIIYYGHERGVVDLASTLCEDCAFQSTFNIQYLNKLDI